MPLRCQDLIFSFLKHFLKYLILKQNTLNEWSIKREIINFFLESYIFAFMAKNLIKFVF